MTTAATKSARPRWHFQPQDLDAQIAPYYHWPPKFGPALRYIAASWGPGGIRVYLLGLALLTWAYFAPTLERCREFGIDWMAQIWLRNLATMLLVAGSLHLYFYRFKKQGDTEKAEYQQRQPDAVPAQP